MRLFVTGATGVIGRALRPVARAAGHQLVMPRHDQLDLFDPLAVAGAIRDADPDAVLHLATRILPLDQLTDPEAWYENDRLRIEATRLLVDASLAARVRVFVMPTVAFVYPPGGRTTEDTPVGDVTPTVRSALVAEHETARFTHAGRRGVVLRLGLLDGPGTGHATPVASFGATLHVGDAALALLSALDLAAGIYNVCRDGEYVSNRRFTEAAGWHPISSQTQSAFAGL
ncbi:MAG TPA: NAD-dependent epimerase/dehydratase family protein [Solirubrobacteraceae bacterium]|nr:NAD-dependent epimerase/dehydratase family protein [Solirubrobacteraceae bacterium]